ncbi:MAG: ribonuclease Y [Dehalococcoidia bacterium]|nr:ribonuclease Y [Dehalococcoidia bacterium]MDW8120251.1 ribonuclease Y [Chloroflexota bacterium]
MIPLVLLVLAVLAAMGIGVVGGYLVHKARADRRLAEAEARLQEVQRQAQEEHKRLLLEAKEEALKARAAAEADLREQRRELQRLEARLNNREEALERRAEVLERRERAVAHKEKEVEQALAHAEEAKAQYLKQLESLAGLSVDEARTLLLKRVEAEAESDIARRLWELEQQFHEEANEKARRIIAQAIHRLAADVTAESTVTVIPIPSEEMKGRLIGREGRNIRAIEQATGVDLIIDDTPDAVTISCFDPVRREVARIALQKLIQDGRIHPARIEETVALARQEVEETIRQAGQQALFAVGVGGLHPELVRLLGVLHYRTSYGQNVLKHSIEVALLASMMGAEIGAHVETCKVGGLLHDIGKALTHEQEGPHAEIGAEVAAKYGVPEPVRRAILEHHNDQPSSVEAFLVAAADAISASRPGARKDTLEHYVKRLEALEAVASSFPGVEKCYAIQAGREVRVMVKPQEVDDIGATKLARDISKKIQETVVYPGQVKVVVIRETRAVEYAR